MSEQPEFGRIPPHSEEAEAAVLGAFLNFGDTWIPRAQLEFQVDEHSFYFPSHATLCKVAFDVMAEKGACDQLMVTAELRRLGVLEECGGLEYLQECSAKAVIEAHLVHYIEVVRSRALVRSAIAASQELIDRGFQAEDGEAFLMSAPQAFYDLIPSKKGQTSPAEIMRTNMDYWQRAHDGEKELMGLSTGFSELDKTTGGLPPGLVILAGRPSAGKTSLEGCIRTHNAMNGVPFATVALDMSTRMLLARDQCRHAGVSMPKLNGGYTSREHLRQVKRATDEILDWPMYTLPGVTDVREICTWARLMKAKHDIQALSIDYIQLCTAAHLGRAANDENARMSEVSERLKALGLELDIPIIALSQFNRSGERDNRPPSLIDLRGSGSLEQAATMALFVYKFKDYDYPKNPADPRSEKKRRAVIVELAKNQNGEVGKVPFWFHCPYFKFEMSRPGFEEGNYMAPDEMEYTDEEPEPETVAPWEAGG